MQKKQQRIGIVGGGPAALFMYKRLVDSGEKNLHITVFERKSEFGSGMPYSTEGAGDEHVTNVSDNELPTLVTNVETWLQSAPPQLHQRFGIAPDNFNEYKVLPRLLFGQYLAGQFDLLHKQAKRLGVTTTLLAETVVSDVTDNTETQTVTVTTETGNQYEFDTIIVCTGHRWPTKHEGKIPGWFDSPYPPQKLQQQVNFPVAIKGASLTAVDAVRTLARANGCFTENEGGSISFELNAGSKDFKIVMHALDGLLPALRFHLDDPLLHRDYVIGEDEIHELKAKSGGFLSLDYVFDRTFKQPIREQEPALFDRIKDMSIEEFVADMMSLRERLDPFTLFKAEYNEAEKSIRRRQSVYWKEMLAVLSYSLNYPAKHLSAEDMLRLKKVLMPLISIVIAFVPQSSYREFIALHDAGVLSLLSVDKESKVEPIPEGGALYTHTNEEGEQIETVYKMFVNAVGQPGFMIKDFPFQGLVAGGTVSPAYLAFQSKEAGEKEAAGNEDVFTDSQQQYYLSVPGIQINDSFQVVDKYGVANNRIYMMAVPYISGLNPDYSGLDFCEEASSRIVEAILPEAKAAIEAA